MKKEIIFLKSQGDARLAELVHEGNNAAFDVLMERHSPHLKKFLHHLLHHNTNEKDALQSIWLAVLTELRRNHYRENGQFTGWLNKIAYN
ncbi:MAG: RNA polymerase sigma factor, partial [Bacteroidia bacterium]